MMGIAMGRKDVMIPKNGDTDLYTRAYVALFFSYLLYAE
jgi:hypothetical protein